MTHPAIAQGGTAVITGGGSGIGRAVARTLADHGMRIALIDRSDAALAEAKDILTEDGAPAVHTINADVSDRMSMVAAAAEIQGALGVPRFLLANAGIGMQSAILGPDEAWDATLSVNLLGVIHAVRAFAPAMAASGAPGAIICTGSKQGITTPPGNPAYNVSKAGVKAFTEALAHELRNTDGAQVSAHLLIPGFVFTGMTAGNRIEKPAAAWTAEETATFFFDSLDRGDFYILCPDNDVPRALDEKRMAWAMGDIIENRPALSRWHPDYAEAFKAHIEA
ncbi:MAG: SDR family NAD(P)-dependent oxidoreductase [Pseudomonadota bacterium]